MPDSISTLSRKLRTVMWCPALWSLLAAQNKLREMPEEIRYLANASSHSAPNSKGNAKNLLEGFVTPARWH